MITGVDAGALEGLVGYNARRASLYLIGAIHAAFTQGVDGAGFKPVEFSVMSLVAENPFITSRQLCAALWIAPPNFVGLVKRLESRGWINKLAHPSDGRATGLQITPQGQQWLARARTQVEKSDAAACSVLSHAEVKQLNFLLQKLYKGKADSDKQARHMRKI
jgi:DNA-binding MarR family transcriptional regulator